MKVNLTTTDANVARAWVAAVSDEQLKDPMHTTMSKAERANFCNDANVRVTIACIQI